MCHKREYHRKETYDVESVLKHVEIATTKKEIVLFDGDPIKMGSDRYKVFKFKGCSCVECGMVGIYFAKEKPTKQITNSFHFNLYGIKDGREVMMTKDHIHPKSKGGKNCLENYQPMCKECNEQKSNKLYSNTVL